MAKSPKPEMSFPELALDLAEGSIVTQALARLIEQVLKEVHATQIAPRDKALKAIIANPHGCIYCDSGTLRRPNTPGKEHEWTCGYLMAEQVLSNRP